MTSPTLATSVSLRKDGTVRPFRRVLIANRGEIAVRIQRTCHDLGIETVAVYSDADAASLHVERADVAIRLGPAPASESYLRADLVIDAALANGADAVHPGYGFLSERASFARAVADAGLAWVGPDAAAIDALGDKLAARRTAADHDVPVVPGTFEPAPVDRTSDVAQIVEAARRIGFPLLVKASAGGGGRGMRRVEAADALPPALTAGSAEAAAAFGDGAVYLEREIRPARHIEVQLLGDRHGDVVALGERDCSVQRRHQKLVEESPAPGLTDEERSRLHELAVRAARAAGLYNAATAEFLFDADRRFWFLEVNARLQVEHGVTELVTGLDLVAEQLWIAAGAPLSTAVRQAADRATRPTRHALEVRLAAEDPSRDFAPAPGRVGRWEMPAGPDVRVDTAIRAGDRVAPDYDPMIAKIMTVGPDRATAIARMARALDEVVITGIQTTLPFDRALVRHASFVEESGLSTEWVTRHWDGPAHRAEVIRHASAAAGTALESVESGAHGPSGAAAPRATGAGGGDDGSSAATASRSSSLHKDGGRWRAAGRVTGTDRWPR